MHFIFSLILALIVFHPFAAQAEDKIYERVMKTQTINCGYAEWPPFLRVDPNTKKVSGIMRELWGIIGKKLDLKVNWKTSLGWGEVVPAINSGKIDVFCVSVWPDDGRIKNLLLSRPAFYSAMYLYARADDARFDNNYTALNAPGYRLVGLEGDLSAPILAAHFPKAKPAHLPPLSQQGDMFMAVISGKGDVTLSDAASGEDYMKQNPGKIKQVQGAPVAMVQNAVPLARGETQLKNMIDTVLTDLINDGTIARLIEKYDAVETYAPAPDVVIPGLQKEE